MGWGTYYKYDGYLSHIGKRDIDSKREECESITKCEFGERPTREPGDDSVEVAMSGDDPHVENFDPDDIPF